MHSTRQDKLAFKVIFVCYITNSKLVVLAVSPGNRRRSRVLPVLKILHFYLFKFSSKIRYVIYHIL